MGLIIEPVADYRHDAVLLRHPDNAARFGRKYHADYVMTCPMMSQSTVFMAAAPNGFYGSWKGHVPAWLERVDLGKVVR